MKKLEQIQSRKTMSAYGGVGSIVETKDNGSLLVDYYNNWGCFGANPAIHKIEINDERLLKHLQKNYNLKIKHLYSIPTPEDMPIYYPKVKNLQETMKGKYFPGWFFCPNCRKLHKWADWEKLWKKEFPADNKFGDNYPACYHCSKRNTRGISRKPLEQIRFCMASLETGKIEDIPFDLLFGAQEEAKFFDLRNVSPIDGEIEYSTSANSDGLQSNYIRCNDHRISFAKIASKYILYGGAAYKLVLKNQNNVYYPEIVSGLYIPQDVNMQQHADEIINAYNLGNDAAKIATMLKAFKGLDLPVSAIQSVIDGKIFDELDFDVQEYAYITNPKNYQDGINDSNDDFYAKGMSTLRHTFVKKFYSILRLREDTTIP